jgi:hypothetical protein
MIFLPLFFLSSLKSKLKSKFRERLPEKEAGKRDFGTA